MKSSSTITNDGTENRKERIRLIWHRRDLRLHDNALYQETGDIPSISLYIFDQAYFQPQPSSIDKSSKTIWCGPHSSQTLIESVLSLKHRIEELGGLLLIRYGDPLEIIPQIAQEIQATEIWCHEEPGTYEQTIVQKLSQYYYSFDTYYGDTEYTNSIKLISKVGYTLYHPEDLPTDPNDWNRLAHPKNKHKKKKKKKLVSSMHKMNPRNSHLVDVSIDRFKGICRIMGDFRKAARSSAQIRKCLEPPDNLILPKQFSMSMLKEGIGSVPSLEELCKPLLNMEIPILGTDAATIQSIVNSAIMNRNQRNQKPQDYNCYGEEAALRRLRFFVHGGHASTSDRSLADVSNNQSSRFSTHLALGTLSPRTVYWEVYKYAYKNDSKQCTETVQENEKNDDIPNCEWIMSHLEMRDFFLYTAFSSGSNFYQLKGLPVSQKQKEANIQWNHPKQSKTEWKRWYTGTTHFPLVDAGMRELISTGYCSNRVRQNLASFLTKDLELDWRVGAEWFQILLEDHCVGANWGNWLYFSGVGPDPKQRHFRTISQMLRYDREGTYAKKWLSELKNVDDLETLFRPWDYDIQGYKDPIVDPKSQYTWNDMQRLKENHKLLD